MWLKAYFWEDTISEIDVWKKTHNLYFRLSVIDGEIVSRSGHSSSNLKVASSNPNGRKKGVKRVLRYKNVSFHASVAWKSLTPIACHAESLITLLCSLNTIHMMEVKHSLGLEVKFIWHLKTGLGNQQFVKLNWSKWTDIPNPVADKLLH